MNRAVYILAFGALTSAGVAGEIGWEAEMALSTDMSVDGGYRPKTEEEASKLSGGKWLSGRYDHSGVFAEYAIPVPADGRYQLLVRKFWLHGPFRWRFDDGAWYQAKELKLLDSVVMRPSVPVCWAKLGNVQLTAGQHKFRVELISDPGYRFSTVFGLDCFLLTTEPFSNQVVTADEPPAYVPEAKLKTGDGLDENGIPLEADVATFGRHLQRTMSWFAEGRPVRILFYGQSIVAERQVETHLVAFLKQHYPTAALTVENRAIGGYQAPRLKRTAWEDLYPYYPDLLVFHVYGGEDDGSLEEIFRNVRQFTTAEVLTWTHHADLLHQDAYRDRASAYRQSLAEKYGFELSDVREVWKQFLNIQGIPAEGFLNDQIHTNPRGGELMARILERHLQPTGGAHDDRIRLYSLAEKSPAIELTGTGLSKTDAGIVLSQPSQRLKLKFKGNRVDLISQPSVTPPGTARVLVDGQPPSHDARGYAATRPSACPGGWWPAINCVELGPDLQAENWTLSVRDLKDATNFTFELKGSLTGADGSGHSGEAFVSKSGRIRIDPKDFALAQSKALPASFDVTWRTYLLGRDQYKADAARESRATVFQQLEPGEHVLELIPNGDGPVPVNKAEVYDPSYNPNR